MERGGARAPQLLRRESCAASDAFVYSAFFFFQAEDGIRDYKVTGVQTCALPISMRGEQDEQLSRLRVGQLRRWSVRDRKSTRLNSSHLVISYAVFCLKKKNKNTPHSSAATHYRNFGAHTCT